MSKNGSVLTIKYFTFQPILYIGFPKEFNNSDLLYHPILYQMLYV